jgi:hypothetical protein
MNALFTLSELDHLTTSQIDSLHHQLLNMLMATARGSSSRAMILQALDRIEYLLGLRATQIRRHIRRR